MTVDTPRPRTKKQEDYYQKKKALGAVGVLVRACDHFGVLDKYKTELEGIKVFFTDPNGKKHAAKARAAVGTEA